MTDTTTTRQLRRSTTDRKLGGIAGGLGEYFGIDPVLVRVALVLLFFAGGAGLLAYLVGWLVIPEDDRSGASTDAGSPPDATTVAGVILLAVAGTILLNGWWWTGDLVVPLLLIGGGAWLLLRDDGGTNDGETDRTEDRVPVPAGQPVPTPATGTTPPPPPGRHTTTAPGPPPPPTAPSGPPTGRITLGLVALLAGAFGIAHAAGARPSIEAVLLSCLALTAAGLLVGTFTGRARGLIALAVPLVMALSFVSAVDIPLSGGVGERRFEPATVAELGDTYELTAGTLVLDLRQLPAEELPTSPGPPTTVEVGLGMGELRILTPADVTVRADVEMTAGRVDFFGDVDDGIDLHVLDERTATSGAPVLELLVDVALGEVTVR